MYVHLLGVRCMLSTLFGQQSRKVFEMLFVCSFPFLQLLELFCQQVNLAVQERVSFLLSNKTDFRLFKPVIRCSWSFTSVWKCWASSFAQLLHVVF